jgi:hypothetical protein
VSRRDFKQRQSRRLNWIILQELAEQCLREDQEQTDAPLTKQPSTLNSPKPNEAMQEVSR